MKRLATSQSGEKFLLLIDRQEYWRQHSAATLKAAGFQVEVLDSYEYSERPTQQKPDLAILGCAIVGKDEQKLIAHLLDLKVHLLVLCTSMSSRVMRTLFLAGADDVAEKPYNPDHLLNAVTHAFKSISSQPDN